MAKTKRDPRTTNTQLLAEEKAMSDALFASLGEAALATDRYGKIMRINEAALNLFGYTEDDIVGKKYLNVVSAYDLNGHEIDTLNRPIIRSLMEGKPVSGTLQYVKKNGSLFPVAVTVSPIVLDEKPVGTIQVIRDITVEQQINKAKTEFVSLASHQLRTPLTAIRWYTELLLKGTMGNLNDKQRTSLEQILGVTLRLIGLVGVLLSTARIETGSLAVTPKPSNICELAHDVIDELQPQMSQRKLKVHEDYDASLPLIHLDPELTRAIFQNLLTNAMKYTPDGGKIYVAVKRERNYVLIRIRDTGYGVPKSQQRHIFTKLFRADNVRRLDTDGTGLGLYIVKSIVQNANGRVWFESEEDKGTTFYVRLPLAGMTPKAGQKLS